MSADCATQLGFFLSRSGCAGLRSGVRSSVQRGARGCGEALENGVAVATNQGKMVKGKMEDGQRKSGSPRGPETDEAVGAVDAAVETRRPAAVASGVDPRAAAQHTAAEAA